MDRQPKAFLKLQGSTLVEHAVRAVIPYCNEIVVGLRADDLEAGAKLLSKSFSWMKIRLVAGGEDRQETVARLLEHVTRPLVLLHEVARPFVAPHLFRSVLAAGEETGAAALFVPLRTRDGLALADNGVLRTTLHRNQVVTLQTPHAYSREMLIDAHVRACEGNRREESTVALMDWAGYAVRLVPGCEDNFKITYPEDLERAQAVAAQRHIAISMPAAHNAVFSTHR
ncbi:MAG: 2-C-methyl-D-erythritol 4-phosphate cytidylyltransferase [Anaerolineales bacterium]|nr:2-C-methyl-D-erythritol 4-phosphate cytidylyltransferase [Anaerolineales bacterium]